MDSWDTWLGSLSVPHQHVEGEHTGEGRRAMGRTLNSIWGKVPMEALHLPGPLRDSPFVLQTPH
eukprot:6504680-Prorocentrum_lima.AAC.1